MVMLLQFAKHITRNRIHKINLQVNEINLQISDLRIFHKIALLILQNLLICIFCDEEFIIAFRHEPAQA